MQIREILGFHRGTNKINFLLLHETTLLGKWLQTFRKTFSKVKTSKTILPFEGITGIFSKSSGNH
jgi:hypothetical protein